MSKYGTAIALALLVSSLTGCDKPTDKDRREDSAAFATTSRDANALQNHVHGSTVSTNAKATRANLVDNSSFTASDDVFSPPVFRTVDYPVDGVSLGQGWDSLRDIKTQGRCIQFSAAQAGGQVAHVEMVRVFDSDTLRRALSVTYEAEATAQFGVGGGGGSVKTQFVKSSELNKQHVNLLIKATAQNGVAFTSPPATDAGVIELTPAAHALLEDQSAFLRRCGDSFVSAIERGAELFALYQFSSKKKTDNEQTITSFSASGSYLAFSGSGSTSSASTREAISKNEVSGLKYFHAAHRGLRLPFNEESIKDAVSSLGSAPELQDSQPYRVQLTRYDSLPGWKEGPIKSGSSTREVLVAQYSRLTDLAEAVRDMERNPDDYELAYAYDVQARGTLGAMLQERLSELQNLLKACEDQKEKPESLSFVPTAIAKVLSHCTTGADDFIFSDYPIRSLMPLPKSREQPFYTAMTTDKLNADLANLKAAYDRGFSFGGGNRGGHVDCRRVPQFRGCQDLARQIAEKEREKDVYLADQARWDLAEARYRYWIEEIARAREEAGVVNGALSPSELAMYRREIYCQYMAPPADGQPDASFDGVRCPKRTMAEIVFEGHAVEHAEESDLDITGDEKPTPIEAWQNLEGKIAVFVDQLVRQVPHHYELVDPEYITQGNTLFKAKGKVRVIYFDTDDAKVRALLSLP